MTLAVGFTVLAGLVALMLLPAASIDAEVTFPEARDEPDLKVPTEQAGTFRDAMLQRARVWHASDPAAHDFTRNPPDRSGLLSTDPVQCRFLAHASEGTTQKFRCVLPDGEVVKVKYGRTGEVHAEIAASRLLTALGFGADDMHLVKRVRCYGCPREPFYGLWILDRLRATPFANRLPDHRYTDFEWVAIERRFPGVEVAEGDAEGWAWYELDAIDPHRGASRAEVDALRLAAALLAHWDNKASNQRLVCRGATTRDAAQGECREPWAIIQDLGATFGPNKVDLDTWSRTPIWADTAACRISMKAMPYGGGTFRDVEISEAGRRLLLAQLERLDAARIRQLFAAARFPEFGGGDAADARSWQATFAAKVREIAGAGPCPAT